MNQALAIGPSPPAGGSGGMPSPTQPLGGAGVLPAPQDGIALGGAGASVTLAGLANQAEGAFVMGGAPAPPSGVGTGGPAAPSGIGTGGPAVPSGIGTGGPAVPSGIGTGGPAVPSGIGTGGPVVPGPGVGNGQGQGGGGNPPGQGGGTPPGLPPVGPSFPPGGPAFPPEQSVQSAPQQTLGFQQPEGQAPPSPAGGTAQRAGGGSNLLGSAVSGLGNALDGVVSEAGGLVGGVLGVRGGAASQQNGAPPLPSAPAAPGGAAPASFIDVQVTAPPAAPPATPAFGPESGGAQTQPSDERGPEPESAFGGFRGSAAPEGQPAFPAGTLASQGSSRAGDADGPSSDGAFLGTAAKLVSGATGALGALAGALLDGGGEAAPALARVLTPVLTEPVVGPAIGAVAGGSPEPPGPAPIGAQPAPGNVPGSSPPAPQLHPATLEGAWAAVAAEGASKEGAVSSLPIGPGGTVPPQPPGAGNAPVGATAPTSPGPAQDGIGAMRSLGDAAAALLSDAAALLGAGEATPAGPIAAEAVRFAEGELTRILATLAQLPAGRGLTDPGVMRTVATFLQEPGSLAGLSLAAPTSATLLAFGALLRGALAAPATPQGEAALAGLRALFAERPADAAALVALLAAQASRTGVPIGLPLLATSVRRDDDEPAVAGAKGTRTAEGSHTGVPAVDRRGRPLAPAERTRLAALAVDPRHGPAPEGFAALDAERRYGVALRRSADPAFDFVDGSGASWNVVTPTEPSGLESVLRRASERAGLILSFARLDDHAAGAAAALVARLGSVPGMGRILVVEDGEE